MNSVEKLVKVAAALKEWMMGNCRVASLVLILAERMDVKWEGTMEQCWDEKLGVQTALKAEMSE